MEATFVEGLDYNNMTERDLQLRLIFSVVVAGKNAKFAHNVCDKLFGNFKMLPFDVIHHWIKRDVLMYKLKEAKSGNYGKLYKCLPLLIKLNPKTCTLDELEAIPGIGPKTSRFYHLWIGKETKCAALDTHVLKFLRDLGYKSTKTTPSGKKYKELEQAFLNECKKRGLSPNQLDADVWSAYSSKDQSKITALIS